MSRAPLVSLSMFGGSVERFTSDLRHGLRALRRSPIFTIVAILSLALGIGATTAIFSIVHALMLKALPVEDPQQLVQLIRTGDNTINTNPMWEALRDRTQPDVFSHAFAFQQVTFDQSTGGETQPLRGLYVSGDYFATLGVTALLGRTLTIDDDRRGGGTMGPVAVLSYQAWRDRYEGAVDVIGRTISLDGHPVTIVGVTPPGFFGASVGDTFDVAVTLASEGVMRGKDSQLDSRGSYWLYIVGRLAPGVSREQAEARLKALKPQFAQAFMMEQSAAGRRLYERETLTLKPAASGLSHMRTRYRMALLTLMGAVALVLLIACANLANLLLARASVQQREFAVRLALGASRARLVRQLLTESLLLALGGAMFGLLFAQWASVLIVRMIDGSRDTAFLDLSLDTPVLGFTLGVAVLTAIVFGVAPAFRSTDLSANDLMKSHGQSVSPGFRLEKLLVVVQVALSLVLVVGAALFVRSFARLITLDPGFDRRQVLVMDTDARGAAYPAEQRIAAFNRIVETLRAQPGVQSAAATVSMPISRFMSMSMASVPGAGPGSVNTYIHRVSPGYFATLGTPIYAGRDFTDRDTRDAPSVGIINEAAAKKLFGGVNPVGRFVKVMGEGSKDAGTLIVGLAKDSKCTSLRADVPVTVYFPMAQQSQPSEYRTFLIRMGPRPLEASGARARGALDAIEASGISETRGASGYASSPDLATLTRGIAAAMRDIHPRISLEFRVFETMVNDSLAQERLIATLSGFFGTLALLVAGIGIYGVMSLAVSRRRQEIGIRMALGAEPSSVTKLVLRDVAIVTIAGVVIGIAGGLLSARLVASLLFEIEPTNITMWLAAIATLLATAAIAGYLPARRASRLEPMLALRDE